MNKKSLSTLTIIAFAVLFCFFAVHAQTRGRYFAEIPFEFAFGNDLYNAGSFEVALELPRYDTNVFTLRDGDRKTLKRVVALRSGNRSADDEVKFVFDHYAHGYVLKEVVGPGFGFAAPQLSEAVWVDITQNRVARPETVTVAFRRRMERAP